MLLYLHLYLGLGRQYGVLIMYSYKYLLNLKCTFSRYKQCCDNLVCAYSVWYYIVFAY